MCLIRTQIESRPNNNHLIRLNQPHISFEKSKFLNSTWDNSYKKNRISVVQKNRKDERKMPEVLLGAVRRCQETQELPTVYVSPIEPTITGITTGHTVTIDITYIELPADAPLPFLSNNTYTHIHRVSL